jgi:hypothetical protein
MSLNKVNFTCRTMHNKKDNKPSGYLCHPSNNIENFYAESSIPDVLAAITAAADATAAQAVFTTLTVALADKPIFDAMNAAVAAALVANPSATVADLVTVATTASTPAPPSPPTPPPTYTLNNIVCLPNAKNTYVPKVININSSLPVCPPAGGPKYNVSNTLSIKSIKINGVGGRVFTPAKFTTADPLNPGINYWSVPYNANFIVEINPIINDPATGLPASDVIWISNYGGQEINPKGVAAANAAGNGENCQFYSPPSALKSGNLGEIKIIYGGDEVAIMYITFGQNTANIV